MTLNTKFIKNIDANGCKLFVYTNGIISLLVFVVGFVATSMARPLSPSQIDSLVLRSMKTFDVPGMAVAVIKNEIHFPAHRFQL